MEERDHATQVFLQWFITEQVEEEANVSDIVGRIQLAGDNGGALMMLDEKLALRQPPAPRAALGPGPGPWAWAHSTRP